MASPAHADISPPSVADTTQTLLTRFAVALNRRRAYRSSHPMVVSAEQQLLDTISALMSSRQELVLGIGPRELLWDGKRIRSRLAVTREVAARLHRRGVSAITFQTGVTLESVRSLLGWLTGDPTAIAEAASTSETGTPALPGFLIGRIPYDQLVLADSVDANEAQVATVWQALASVALTKRNAAGSSAQARAEAEAVSGSEIVAAIRGGATDKEYVQRVSSMLFTLVDQATHATLQQRAAIGERLAAVLPMLDAHSLGVILVHVGDENEQREFVAQVAEVLPVHAVVDWLEVASRTGKRSLSHHLLRLLRKLSTLSQVRVGTSGPDSSFRDATLDLVSGWDLDDPNPGEHVELLDQIALIEFDRSGKADGTSPTAFLSEKQGEAARLVQMALELDEVSQDAREAVHQLMMEHRAIEVLSWIDQAKGNTASAELLAAAASPQVLAALLLRDTPDVNVARALLAAAGENTIPVLFDVLAASSVRMIRRLVMDRLREFGAPIWKVLLTRLDDNTWYFARNLLGLMRDVRAAVRDAGGDITPLPITGVVRFLSHAREQLRLEAVRLLLDDATMRDGTLRRALEDAHPRVVREALEWIIHQSDGMTTKSENVLRSNDLFARLLRLIDNKQLADEIRARAVWALDSQRDVATRDWLLAHATRKKIITRRTVLAESRPTVLAALGLLAKRFPHDKSVAPVLRMAEGANDLRSHAVSGSPAHTNNKLPQ